MISVSGARGEHTVQMSTAAWPAGVYVVRAEVGGEIVSARFTVVR